MPLPDVLILGQGLAGTVLGWELERAGISFSIADPGDGNTASLAAAGMLNPITGRRIVKSWRADTLLPIARASFGALAREWGVAIWHGLRVRRQFADHRERELFRMKRAELAPFAGESDDAGFWIEDAARVDLPQLLGAARQRWTASGRLSAIRLTPAEAVGRAAMVIDCRGLATTAGSEFAFVPWEFSRGETLEIETAGLVPGVVLNAGHWVLPLDTTRALVGATHEPGRRDGAPTTAARTSLEASARRLLGREFVVRAQRAGVRVTLGDKRPVAGRHPALGGLGVLNALGAKGALLAPWLARQWVAHLRAGAPFDLEADVGRFAGNRASP
jgi:glycine/D-amino acid oxidase-like deaminating enzyme